MRCTTVRARAYSPLAAVWAASFFTCPVLDHTHAPRATSNRCHPVILVRHEDHRVALLKVWVLAEDFATPIGLQLKSSKHTTSEVVFGRQHDVDGDQ